MQRTLFIGLDGCTFTILDPLMKDGVMPFLRDYVAGGVRAELLSTPNPLTPPAWTSLVTGRTPGHHGIFDFIRAEEGPQGLYFTLNTSDDIRCETIWSMINRHHGTVTSLNFPVSSPPPPVNGYLIPGFVPWKHLRRSVHPPEFYEVLKGLPGFDAKALAMDMNDELKSIQWLPQEEYEAWITHHIQRERQWFTIARHLLETRPTDFVAVLFDGVDKLQHLCWRYMDPHLFPDHPTPFESKVRDLCLGYFRRLDGLIRDLITLAGPDTRVYFASDHGFGATHEVFYANVWLRQEGYLAWAEESSKDDLGRMAADKIKSHVVGIDWSKTLAYALTPSSNGIFIRREDGSGRPGVRPGDYQAFRSQLADKLLALRHPETGARIIRKVMTREEAFPGSASHQAPDLTLVLEDYGFLSVLNADAPVKPRPEPAGTHRPQGIFLAGGPGIAKGRMLEPLSIIDVAPTLLHSLGLPIPSDLEGRVADRCFDEAFLLAQPVVTGEPTRLIDGQWAREPEQALQSDANEKVMASLKALGYME
ncbi:MAG TPA: alkaline phosphatase family protein [Nitrospiria bacterium]|nr:alkaline phosphatase family protein [Nitrospiria bacterium]